MHCACASLSVAEPGAHGRQSRSCPASSPPVAQLPCKQSVHRHAPASDEVPAPHGAHLSMPRDTWREQRAQRTHDFRPVVGWNMPTSQGSHRSMPLLPPFIAAPFVASFGRARLGSPQPLAAESRARWTSKPRACPGHAQAPFGFWTRRLGRPDGAVRSPGAPTASSTERAGS